MDYEPAEYRKLALKQFPPRALRETAEGRYWKQFANPVNAQQVGHVFAASQRSGQWLEAWVRRRHQDEHCRFLQAGAVSHISFTQQYPYNFAVTSSTRVRLVLEAMKALVSLLGNGA